MASHPEFDGYTTATQVANAFPEQIKGRNILVTGVGPGTIGSTTVLAIASQKPSHLILASRTKSKLDAVADDIRAKYPDVSLQIILLDLTSVDSIREAAAQVTVDHLDVLINNAGISHPTRDPILTPDGTTVDLQFFCNHLGVFLLTSLLLPKLLAAAAASPRGATRVVNLSTGGHRLSPVRFSDVTFSKGLYEVPEAEQPPTALPEKWHCMTDGYPGFIAYGQSKSATMMHAAELSRRFGDRGLVALSLHPGSINTELSRSLDPERAAAISNLPVQWKDMDQGSSTTLVAAFDPKLGELDIGGEVLGYLNDCQVAEELASPHTKDREAAARLWEWSEKMMGITVDSKNGTVSRL